MAEDSASGNVYALPAGTRLQEFRIERVLGHGGFGITYLAKNTDTGETVAIKEYLPSELAVRVSNSTVRVRVSADQKLFDDGVFAFLKEAQRIARVVHPNITAVKKFFRMNGTAYIVLRYEHGQTVKERAETAMSETAVRSMLEGVLQGLVAIHTDKSALLHRDIKPANIILSRNRSDQKLVPVLIDFGAAREFRNRNSRSVTALVSQGYSPPEQYGAGGQQGPWSDLYALGATAYRCVTGAPPPDSLTRLGKDTMPPAAVKAKGRYSDDLLRLIDWMMMVKEAERPRSAREALQALRASRTAVATSDATDATSGARRGGKVKVSGDGAQNFVLQFDDSPRSDTLGMAFKVTPPNRFIGPGRVFQSGPHFFKLNRVEGEQGQTGYRGGPEIRRRLRRGSKVGLLSEDGSINAETDWPLASGVGGGGGGGLSKRLVIVLALSLVAYAAAAMNIGPIQDTVCDKTGMCTSQQLLFRSAQQCVQRASSCAIDSCVADFRTKATLPRLVDRMSTIEGAANAACRNADSAAFQTAKTCADQKRAANVCEVEACYSGYLSSQPRGEHAREARAGAASARQDCQARMRAAQASPTPAPQPTPQASRQPPRPPTPTPSASATPSPSPTASPAASASPSPAPSQTPAPRPTPAVALPDGTYNAVRTFIEAKSQSDPLSCPPSTNLQVTVRGQLIQFESREANTGITRKWRGTVLANGKIAFLGSEATPPTPNFMAIIGMYDSAQIDSKFCGKGFFKITK